MTIKQRLVSDEFQTVTRWTIGQQTIFTVVCLVAWSLNDYESGAAHFLIETSLLLRTASLTEEPLKSTYTVVMEVSS